tara:strand:- start:700 stop:1305 length:606 start_codon:yes stop_codon:yes gene_type:complete
MCFPNTSYSHDIARGIMSQLNDKFLNQIRTTGSDFFNQWRARIEKKNIEQMITHLILTTIKELKIPVFSVNGYFNDYLETQVAYFIFESLLHDPLDSSNINDLPLLEIPINSVFYTIPKKEDEVINKFNNRFSQMKEKKIDFTQDISGIDKTLLNIKLEMELELAIKRVQFKPLIKRIYDDYNTKMNAENNQLKNEILSNI